MKRRILTRGAGWVLVLRDSASEVERSVHGKASDSQAVHLLVSPRIREEIVEVMYVLLLNGSHHVIGMSEVARGSISGIRISPVDAFRAACAIGANAIVLVHNHPSGDPTPSLEDMKFTSQVVAASEVLGIPVVDHVIVAGDRYYSFLDNGTLNQ